MVEHDGHDYDRAERYELPVGGHAEQYKSVDIWIDGEADLPAKLSAVSTEGDIYEIKFVAPKVNKPVDEKAFEFKIPDDFGKPEMIPLKK